MADSPEDELIQKFLDRVLTPTELEGLNRRLAADDAFARAFAEATRYESFLQTSLKELRESAPRPLTTRRSVRKTPEARPRFPWILVWAAAGILVGFALLMTFSGNESAEKPDTVRRREVKRPAREDAERRRALAESDRREAEAELRKIEQRREVLARPPAGPSKDLQAEESRKKALEELKVENERIERRLKEAIARSRVLPEDSREEGKKPVAPHDPPAPKQDVMTQAAIALLELVEGEAAVVTRDGTSPAKAGADFMTTQGLEIGGGPSRIVLRFPDKTRMEFGPETTLNEIKIDGGKRILLARGNVRAEVARQPKDRPVIFATPHGDARVLGTSLRLIVDPDPAKGTQLEVKEGKVELKNLAGKAVLVESGHYAVAAVGAELAAKPLAFLVREVVLYAADLTRGELHGGWRNVPDETAAESTKLVLPWISEKVVIFPASATPASYVEWSFEAPANIPFRLWVRLKAEPGLQNSFYVQFSDAVDGAGRPMFRIGTAEAMTLNAIVAPEIKGWFWERDLNRKDPSRTANPTIRFAKTGKHRLRLQVRELGVSLDQVVLSAGKYLDQAPGATSEDATILPRPIPK